VSDGQPADSPLCGVCWDLASAKLHARPAGRPPIGQKRMHDKITVRLDDGMRGMIEAQAGALSAGEWIRWAIRLRLALGK